MARKGLIQKELLRKQLHKKVEARRKRLKEVANNQDLSLKERQEARFKLDKLPRNSAKERQRNRCELTGRPRGYHRRFGLCRNMIRDEALGGNLPGVQKSSW